MITGVRAHVMPTSPTIKKSGQQSPPQGTDIVSFDLEKLQAVAELGEVIRLQNEALDRLRDSEKLALISSCPT